MPIIAFIIGWLLVITVLWDAFETVVLPRRVTRRFRLVRAFYRFTWPFWSGGIRMLAPGRSRENALGYYGPLSFILLLTIWAAGLITGFGLLYWSMGDAIGTPGRTASFGICLYFSGTSFFTLGLGDIAPHSPAARLFSVLEAGMGFGFLAVVISYLPAIHQSFARREVNISLLDARAGSPPTAAEILKRHCDDIPDLTRLLSDWERWSAEMLESHLSFPVLVYFRSQHDNQSWLAALTAILDTAAFVIASFEGECVRQARLTFSMVRHAIVDLSLVLHRQPETPPGDRLPPDELASLRALLRTEGMQLRADPDSDRELQVLRMQYESYIYALSQWLVMPLPPWALTSVRLDNWQISAWGPEDGKKGHF